MLNTLKHWIDYFSAPAFSFSIFSFLFVWALFQRRVWTKQGTIIAMTVITVGLAMALQDANFRVTLLKPDNAPIFLMIYLFGFFLWVAMTQAHNNDRRMEEKLPPAEKETSDQKTWVWPDLVYIEFLCMILCTVGLVVWSLAVPAPLEEPANPSNTPNPSKAPWYFLGLQELLVYFDPWFAGVVLPSIIVLGLMAIPFIDVNPKGSGYFCFKDRRLAIVTFLIGFFVMWDFLIPIGTILRGPGWNFFGPFEQWSPHKVVSLTNVNLSEAVWVKGFYGLGEWAGWDWLKQGLPVTTSQFIFVWDHQGFRFEREGFWNLLRVCQKEFVGIIFLLIYFLYLPGKLARGWLKGFYEKLGFARYSVAIFLFLTMATVPMKMYLRWLVNLKYIVDTPWIKF